MSTKNCQYTYKGANAYLGICDAPEDNDAHIPSYHEGCKGVDKAACMLHTFDPGEAQHILDSRKVREAAVMVADLAPPLAEALHLKAQDIFEAGEEEQRLLDLHALFTGVYAVRTRNGVYIVEAYANGQAQVRSRTVLEPGGWLDPTQSYSGWVIGKHPVVGERFRFEWSERPADGPINVSPVVSITRLPAE